MAHLSIARSFGIAATCFALGFSIAQFAEAARPSDVLLPNTTKGYVSVADIRQLEEKWLETQMGQLLEDPAMKPFVDQLSMQFKGQAARGLKVSLGFEDLKKIAGGEVSLARIQPDGDKSKHATVLLIDVTGKNDDAAALLKRLTKELTDQGATKRSVKVGNAKMDRIVLPARPGKHAEIVYLGIHEDVLICINHLETLKGIISRFKGEPMDSLAGVPAYKVAMQRSKQAAGEMAPDARWFIEPFGLVETARADAGQKKRGTDFLKVFSNTGFRCIQGGGGYVMISTGEHEILHYSFAYAPGEFEKGAKMLDFPNSEDLEAQPWISRNGAMFATFRWDLKEAFNAAKWIVDEIAGDPIFEDVLKGIKNEDTGPKIDVRKELVAHLSDRATVMTDYRMPITTESERFVIAIEVTNPRIVQRTVNRAMEHDPQAVKREFGGHVIWEIVNEDDEDELDGPAIDGVPGLGDDFDDDYDDAMDTALPNSAVTVANNHLLIGSHVDYLRDFLADLDEKDRLRSAKDYQIVNYELEKIGAGMDSFRIFSRLDESLRATYQLIQQNKMPESKSIAGMVLNGLLAAGEEEGVPRKQKLDGDKLPDYDIVRRYLGPMGIYVRTTDEGWLAAGCVLTKDHPGEE